MELTEKQKAAFQELAEWARKYDAAIQGDEDIDIMIEDTAFELDHCSNQGVTIFSCGYFGVPTEFFAKQQEGGK